MLKVSVTYLPLINYIGQFHFPYIDAYTCTISTTQLFNHIRTQEFMDGYKAKR